MDIPHNPRFQRLYEIITTAADLQSASAVLSWDQQTHMPTSGALVRAQQRATLARLAHEMLVSDAVGELLTSLIHEYDLTSTEDAPSFLRMVYRRYEKACRLPARLVAELAQATVLAQGAWVRAKQDSNFAVFQPALEQILALCIEKAERLGYAQSRYDALLDQYEPDTSTQEVAAVFADLKAGMLPLVQEIAGCSSIDDSFLYQPFALDKQWEFGLEMLQAIGFDLSRGRQDVSAHPVTTTINRDDVRLTTWRRSADLQAPLFSTLHEGGHGIHGQNRPIRFERTPLAQAPGQGISESQSRLFENLVGRSRPFWEKHYPRLQAYFPAQLGQVDLQQFYHAVNKVEPSFIRTEADELTYHLHIMLRFELEQDLISERIRISDLPAAWNAKMHDYLGIVPPNDAMGVLQDVHWSMGMIGYFPTYTLGSLLAVQLRDLALQEQPEIDEELAKGECTRLREWLVDRVYSWGNKLTSPALVQQITGGPIKAEPFIDYAQAKYSDIYGLG